MNNRGTKRETIVDNSTHIECVNNNRMYCYTDYIYRCDKTFFIES